MNSNEQFCNLSIPSMFACSDVAFNVNLISIKVT